MAEYDVVEIMKQVLVAQRLADARAIDALYEEVVDEVVKELRHEVTDWTNQDEWESFFAAAESIIGDGSLALIRLKELVVSVHGD